MKKTIVVVLAVLAAALLSATVWLSSKSLSPSIGTYLSATSGSHLILVDNSPIVMGNQGVTFDALESGDQILILHDGIEETYPAHTGVYFLLKLGQSSSVPEDVLQKLTELGWHIEYPPISCTNGG